MSWFYTVQMFEKQQPDFKQLVLGDSSCAACPCTHVCENVNMSATFLGKNIYATTSSAYNAVLVDHHTYQEKLS